MRIMPGSLKLRIGLAGFASPRNRERVSERVNMYFVLVAMGPTGQLVADIHCCLGNTTAAL